MDKFKNNLKQNITIFITVFVLILVIEKILFNTPINILVHWILPDDGVGIIINTLVLAFVFILPWRPVRRTLWNSVFKLKETIVHKNWSMPKLSLKKPSFRRFSRKSIKVNMNDAIKNHEGLTVSENEENNSYTVHIKD